jgi:uroporphyrinogen decarboxylase
MNSRDLVKAAIARRATEQTPYCIMFTGQGAERFAEAVRPSSVEAYVGNDIIPVRAPWWSWHELGPEWRGMAAPEAPPGVRGDGSYGAFFDRIKMLRDHTDKYILVMVYGSHFEKANFARGIENFLADMAGDPDFARGLLTRIIDKNMVMLENVLTAPEIDGVLLGSDWGSQLDLMMSPETWEDMIRPGEQREYDLIHGYGKDVWVHSCGNIRKVIPSLIEMGVDVLNPVQPEAMDLEALQRDFGSRLTFWGGVSTQQALPYGTPREVREETERVRALMARDGGYILAPAQEIQADVPPENVMAMVEVAHARRRGLPPPLTVGEGPGVRAAS